MASGQTRCDGSEACVAPRRRARGLIYSDTAVSGAADDRTFVVSDGGVHWDDQRGAYTGIATSGDGTELAVGAVPKAGSRLMLQVYSVATGRLQRSWPASVNVTSSGNIKPVTGLSRVGESRLGSTLTRAPGASIRGGITARSVAGRAGRSHRAGGGSARPRSG